LRGPQVVLRSLLRRRRGGERRGEGWQREGEASPPVSPTLGDTGLGYEWGGLLTLPN
jgi:hypothetical protein